MLSNIEGIIMWGHKLYYYKVKPEAGLARSEWDSSVSAPHLQGPLSMQWERPYKHIYVVIHFGKICKSQIFKKLQLVPLPLSPLPSPLWECSRTSENQQMCWEHIWG